MYGITTVLSMLILCLLMTSKSYSQTDTTQKQNKDSITISRETAMFIVQELKLNDVLKQESSVLKEDTTLLKKQHRLKDSIIAAQDNIISIYERRVDTYMVSEHYFRDIQKENAGRIKRLRIQRTGLGVLLVGSLVFFATR